VVVGSVVSSVMVGDGLVNLGITVGWHIVFPVVITVVCLKSSSLTSNVMGWLNEVSSVGVETVSIISFTMAVVVKVTIDILSISEVVGGDNWLVVVLGRWVIPVDVTSVPGSVSSLLNWLLDVESSVVVVVLSMVSSVLEWNSMD